MTEEKRKFDAEVGKILDLMIHSLYTDKAIFMRELISNSSDACDKLRYLSQTDPLLVADDPNLQITVQIKADQREIIVRDNGIGMDKQDLIENLGTIARSGTQNFINNLSGDAKKDNMLIGQFGVGFYSAFMVADHITVTSQKAGQSAAYTWHSKGCGEYTVTDANTEFSRGTEIVLHIKEGEDDYLDHFRLKHIVKSYSDHIAIPIYFFDANGNNQIQLNSASALWTRPKSDITDEQYLEFYKNLSYSTDNPWLIMHNRNEGSVEFTNLLFIPSTKTFDLFHPDRKRRVKLYIKRVFISDENIDLIPHYLRFLRGVVDSEDLPLNISRETLQHNPTLEKIRNSITRRVLAELKKKKDESMEDYSKFWTNFGGALKEGLCEAATDHEKLLEICIFRSALHDKMISLDEYIASCKDTQKTIYYFSGDNLTKLQKHPQMEGFLTKDIDVLLFTDTVDDFWPNVNGKYKDYEIKSVTRSDIDLAEFASPADTNNSETKEDPKIASYDTLIEYFKNTLGDLVKDVKISKKLSSSPVCLAVQEGSMDIRMERFLIEQKQLVKSSAKILEINPKHKIIEKIYQNLSENNSNYDLLVKLLFDQACIIEGEPVYDPSGFAHRLDEVLEKIV